MRYSENPQDFNDPFGESGASTFFVRDDFFWEQVATYLTVAIPVIAILAVAGWFFGRWLAHLRISARKQNAAEAIYEAIHTVLVAAAQSPASQIFEHALRVRDVLNERLGEVIALHGQIGKPLAELQKALDRARDLPEGELNAKTVIEAELKPLYEVKTETVSDGDGERIVKTVVKKVKTQMTAEQQRLALWNVIRAFHAYWSDKPRVMALIRGAQDELYATGYRRVFRELRQELQLRETEAGLVVMGNDPDPSGPSGGGFWRGWGKASTDASPKNTAKRAKDAPVMSADDAPSLPPSGGKRKLPRHKRNMLP
ncbi:MAG: hypothetical protein QM667_09625 [Asticcacaulis sp.]